MRIGDDPRNTRSRRTRAALLEAARQLIEEQGFEALTMAAVAERAGVSRRAVYLHVASRSELVTALFGYVNEAEDLAASTRPVWEAPDAVAALDEWARHLARYHPRLIRIARAIQRVRDVDADAARHWDIVMRDWRRHCRSLTARLAGEGRLATPWTVESAADLLFALMSFDVLEALLVERRWSRRRLADHLALVFRRTLVAPEPAVVDEWHG
ncbi:MAG: TetR/AcrR family transcriptional regulator [Jiangellaceae bacterium]